MRSCTPLYRRRQALATLPLTAAVSAALSSAALLMPSVASAQLEEVVVTARARAESLQDVPATVTAFTEGQIANMGVERAEDFVYMTPGVTFVNTVEVWATAHSAFAGSMAPEMPRPTLPLSWTACSIPTPRLLTANTLT